MGCDFIGISPTMDNSRFSSQKAMWSLFFGLVNVAITKLLTIEVIGHIRGKFRSQTSDNMDRWKTRGGKSQRREEKKKEDQRRESLGRKKIQAREEVEKLRFTAFFQWFVAPKGWKVGSLKRRVRSHLARWEMKNCTPLWREARFQVKMYKTHHVRTTFGSWDVEKVHAVVARNTFQSQNVQSTPCLEHFWKLRYPPWNSGPHPDPWIFKGPLVAS